jgi:glycosyltransferase involved in cell wall biosynthesis
VAAEDEGALAAALVHLLARPDLRAAAAAAARARAEAFSAERLLTDVAGLYRELLVRSR